MLIWLVHSPALMAEAIADCLTLMLRKIPSLSALQSALLFLVVRLIFTWAWNSLLKDSANWFMLCSSSGVITLNASFSVSILLNTALCVNRSRDFHAAKSKRLVFQVRFFRSAIMLCFATVYQMLSRQLRSRPRLLFQVNFWGKFAWK